MAEAQTVFSFERVIDKGPVRPRGLHLEDLDMDSDLDVLGGSYDDQSIFWYENLGNGLFSNRRIINDEVLGAEGVFTADLDLDGDPDVINAGRLDNSISWYENLGGGSFGPRNLISTETMGAIDVNAADVDNDGDIDILTAGLFDNIIALHRNLGGGAFGPREIIGTDVDYARDVYSVDLDQDGDIDVMSASRGDDIVSWWENMGGGTFGPRKIISTTADGARSVFAADLDDDGDLDVMAADYVDNHVSWYENLGGTVFGPENIISDDQVGARSVRAVDFDGDGDLDILAASEFDFKVAWYENLGGAVFGPQQVIHNLAMGVRHAFAGDMDLDGDMDVVSAIAYIDKFSWYENRGTGSEPFELVQIADGLPEPRVLATEPDGKLFVGDRAGRIVFVRSDQSFSDVPFLDIRDRVNDAFYAGIRGIVVHPAYQNDDNGAFFVSYVNDANELVLSRFLRSSDPEYSDPSSEQILLTIPMPYNAHIGGSLTFGMDGSLYMAIGDGGGIGDPDGVAQDLSSLRGKIIRIDVYPGGYVIPSDNPFVGVAGAREEIWALGLRDPRGISTDRETAAIWVTDGGESSFEEVNRIDPSEAGANLGWPCYEGSAPYDLGGCSSTYQFPDFEYPHASLGQTGISGGVVYRGKAAPDYYGQFLCSDIFSGDLRFLEEGSGTVLSSSNMEGFRHQIRAYTQDLKGEVYLLDDFNGRVLKVAQRCGPTTPVINILSERGSPVKQRLFWGELPDIIIYEVQYWPTIDPSDVTSATTPRHDVNLVGLTPSTQYGWKVRGICNGSVPGSFSAKDTFTTVDLRLAEIPDQDFSVWVGPSEFVLNWNPDECEDGCRVMANDLQGRIIVDEVLIGQNSFRIPTGNLSAGIYFFSLQGPSGRSVIEQFKP
jgi:glucose/arabinose dehydrogenase